MTSEHIWNVELEHNWEVDEDQYASIYPGDVVKIVYRGKFLSGIVQKLYKNSDGKVESIAIHHFDGDQSGSVIVYKVIGGDGADAIESIFVQNQLMPNQRRTKAEIREKMFITFDGVWGKQMLGGWVKKLDQSKPGDLKITIDPLVTDEIMNDEKESLSDWSEVVRRLRGGGVEVS